MKDSVIHARFSNATWFVAVIGRRGQLFNTTIAAPCGWKTAPNTEFITRNRVAGGLPPLASGRSETAASSVHVVQEKNRSVRGTPVPAAV